MKRCTSCGQVLSQKLKTCPACGSESADSITHVDGYRIMAIIHEGRSSIVYKAVKEENKAPVSIRLFTEKSGVDERIATRLEKELETLAKLPPDHFVQHYAVRQSAEGLWYRVSEWVHAADWGSIFMSGILKDPRNMVRLFRNIASVLDLLHKNDHFMPYLILDDILIPEKRLDDLHVKVNYKLSRFLNARATHHGPMLQKLLDCHPDIVNEHPINFKSGIWSLGKVFVEIATADPNLREFYTKVDEILWPDPDLARLIKLMLSDDPDMRPRSMAIIVSELSRILDRIPYADAAPPQPAGKPNRLGELLNLKLTMALLVVVIAGIVALTATSWFSGRSDKEMDTESLARYAQTYVDSVAFLMVKYWLSSEGKTVYTNKVEGTAFLVDKDGYLLTNRHVACPWLEDASMFQVYNQFLVIEKSLEFHYRMYLWFEGDKAFKRLPALGSSAELSDSFFLSTAYSTEPNGRLKIVGVPRTPVSTGELMRSPFTNDFAVLKIDSPPPGITPLPLETRLPATQIKRLSPVVILGFPLGHITQDDRINVSVTSGYVRRTSREIIQVDTSIYKGNSGGPAISSDGKVIGIASGVITDQTPGYFKINTPLSDFGLILPISQPARLIASIKSGRPHWNGVLDFSVADKIARITALADENRFKEAADLSETMLEKSQDSLLIFAGGMLNFCSSDLDKSQTHFRDLSLLEEENITSRLMLYIIDWILDQENNTNLTRRLFTMKWYESDEFSGYLAEVLKHRKRMTPGFVETENQAQQSWRFFIDGLILEKENKLKEAGQLFEKSILSAGANDWVYYLSFSRLNRIRERLKTGKEDHAEQEAADRAFREKAFEYREAAIKRKTAITALISRFESEGLSHEDRIDIYTELLEQAGGNRTILGRIAFFHATHNEWDKALEFIDRYFKTPSRETALGLSLGLLKGQVLLISGQEEASETYLSAFAGTIKNTWYKQIINHILLKTDEDKLIRLAGSTPEKQVTLHTALGLLAEGNRDYKKAAHHYREALSSYMDDWNEYDLALARIKKIRAVTN